MERTYLPHYCLIVFKKNNGYLARKQIPDKPTYNHLLDLVKSGTVERIKQGVYFYENASGDNTMIDVEKIVPEGVLCLYSAWHYGLMVQIPSSFLLRSKNGA